MQKSICSIFTLLILWTSVSSLSAQKVTVNAAKEKATQFLNKPNKSDAARKAPHLAPKLVLANERDELFIFNDEANGGYVIVSGDERTPDVLAYSENGHYDSKHVPCNMQAVLDGYAEQIAYLRAHPAYKMPTTDTRIEEKKVAPLLGETSWSQDWPYNIMCPTIGGQHCLTGCVATATAQLMYYHKWPERGKGIFSYEWNGQTLSVDFSQSVYRWNLMTPKYNSNSIQESCDAVALLMRDVGYACATNYDLYGSGAAGSEWGLIHNFDYDESMGLMFRNYCDADSWHHFIMDDLLNGLPVLYSGGDSKGGEAHALVIDGYDGEGYYHFNLGWGGPPMEITRCCPFVTIYQQK